MSRFLIFHRFAVMAIILLALIGLICRRRLLRSLPGELFLGDQI